MEQMRSYAWCTTAESLGAARGLSGLEYLQKLAAGEFPPPPIASTMGFQLVELTPGRAVFTLVPQEWHYNPIGTVHGGAWPRCAIRPWAARCIRNCRSGQATRPKS